MQQSSLGINVLSWCRWHARCFQCSFCGKPIGLGPVWAEPSQPQVPYCSDVCQAMVHNPCSVCGAPLTGTVRPKTYPLNLIRGHSMDTVRLQALTMLFKLGIQAGEGSAFQPVMAQMLT